MSSVADVAHQMSQVHREENESDESLARRMFYLQMEVYSANAGVMLYGSGDFERLSKEMQNSWLSAAHGVNKEISL